MPRKTELTTENLKRLMVKAAMDVRDGKLDPKRGNVAITGFRAAVYANQVQAGEDRIAVDERLAENMEALNKFLSNGGNLPNLPELTIDQPIEEVADHEKAE